MRIDYRLDCSISLELKEDHFGNPMVHDNRTHYWLRVQFGNGPIDFYDARIGTDGRILVISSRNIIPGVSEKMLDRLAQTVSSRAK